MHANAQSGENGGVDTILIVARTNDPPIPPSFLQCSQGAGAGDAWRVEQNKRQWLNAALVRGRLAEPHQLILPDQLALGVSRWPFGENQVQLTGFHPCMQRTTDGDGEFEVDQRVIAHEFAQNLRQAMHDEVF